MIICIGREYGSGGTKIARRLAEVCKIPCYGPEILEAVSKKNDVSVDRIQKYEETATGSFLYTIFMMSQAGAGDSDMLTKEGHVFACVQSGRHRPPPSWGQRLLR